MLFRPNTFVMIALGLVASAFISCAGPQSPITPATASPGRLQSVGSHICLGLWQFTIDPVHGSLNFVPLRSSQTHLNALAYMEPPAGVLLKVDQVVSTAPGEITVDIALKHPYPAAKYATAFDVCGILIGHGKYFFPLSDKLFFAGEDQVQLLNPDGYTRWWNPVEFPTSDVKPEMGYIDGLLGKPQDVQHFDATLNGYKYFASDLKSPDSDLSELDKSMRGAFVPGTTCIRRYRIGFTPKNLIFNYAVDANWAMPVGPKPIVIPDSFPSSANRTEAYRIEIHNWSNTLNYDSSTSTASGEVAMSVYVYDWFNAGKNLVCAYPQSDALLGTCNPFPTGGDSTYSSYSFELWPMNMKSADDIMVWFEVSCEEDGYQGIIPYQKEAVCFRRIVPVAGG